MIYINPDDEKELATFYREWASHYPSKTMSTGQGKEKVRKTTDGLKPPSIQTLRTLYQYVTNGDVPGENIMAMLSNDLYVTFNTSPLEELELIPSAVQYITIYLPFECWGSAEKYGNWLNNKKRININVDDEQTCTKKVWHSSELTESEIAGALRVEFDMNKSIANFLSCITIKKPARALGTLPIQSLHCLAHEVIAKMLSVFVEIITNEKNSLDFEWMLIQETDLKDLIGWPKTKKDSDLSLH